MRRRRGFTLIELLVSITIMLMLAAMALFGMSRAQNRASVSRTKATITKLHDLILQRWDSYKTRRLPISTLGMSPTDAAELRLVALRQLMRLEMPDRWSEVITGPTDLKRINGTSFGLPLMTRPALSEAYLRYYVAARGAKTDGQMQQFQNAECLYMIVTVGAMDDGTGRELFSDADVGDVDGDGLPEFLDAWGQPIRFLRWPVGFVNDPRQELEVASKRFGHLSQLMPAKNPQSAVAPLVPCKPDAVANHDPFDPRRIDSSAFAIYPLIYSGGPDRIEDIYSGVVDMVRDDPYTDVRNDTSPCATYDPLQTFTEGTPSVGTPKWLGIPHDLNAYRYNTALPVNGKLNHYDNITNHQIDASVK